MSKKLIEVAIPLDVINAACKADKDRKVGHIRNLHKWFAPMPLPAWRAALFASLVDDPGDSVSGAAAEKERYRLFNLIERLVPWDAQHNEGLLAEVRAEIGKHLADDHLTVVDPFCGGGSTLVEAQRLGLSTFGSDLNPVPVLITSVLTTALARFRDLPSVSGAAQLASATSGFVSDIEHYAELIYERAVATVGRLFPPAPDGATVLAWRWTHTVSSPDPRFSGVQTPIPGDWRMTWNRRGHIWVEPLADRDTGSLSFAIREDGAPDAPTMGRNGGRCLFSGAPITTKYVQEEGRDGRLGVRLFGVVATRGKLRTYHSGTPADEQVAFSATPTWEPTIELPDDARNIWCKNYGWVEQKDLYLPRQLLAIDTFAREVAAIHEDVQQAASGPLADDGTPLEDGGGGARAYADAVCAVLALAVSRLAQANSRLVRWRIHPSTSKAEPAFDKQTMPFMWDFVETNPFAESVGSWRQIIRNLVPALSVPVARGETAVVEQLDWTNPKFSRHLRDQ